METDKVYLTVLLVSLILIVVAVLLYVFSMRIQRKKQVETQRLAFERLSNCDKIIFKYKSEVRPGQISLNNVYEIRKKKYDDPEAEKIRREVYGASGLREERKQEMEMQRNVIGEELEQKGRIDEAIVLYEENARTMADTSHAYDRLAIIYRSKKQYDDEIRIIKKAMKRFPGSADYPKRLEKAKAMKATAEIQNKPEKGKP